MKRAVLAETVAREMGKQQAPKQGVWLPCEKVKACGRALNARTLQMKTAKTDREGEQAAKNVLYYLVGSNGRIKSW